MARQVTATWTGAKSVTLAMGDITVPVGDDLALADGGFAPMPTEVLLGSVAACFTIAMAWVAAKRDLTLPGLHVDVTGDYDGPRVSSMHISVHCDADPALVEQLIPRARRVCYVTNSLLTPPQITITREP